MHRTPSSPPGGVTTPPNRPAITRRCALPGDEEDARSTPSNCRFSDDTGDAVLARPLAATKIGNPIDVTAEKEGTLGTSRRPRDLGLSASGFGSNRTASVQQLLAKAA